MALPPQMTMFPLAYVGVPCVGFGLGENLVLPPSVSHSFHNINARKHARIRFCGNRSWQAPGDVNCGEGLIRVVQACWGGVGSGMRVVPGEDPLWGLDVL